MSGATILVVDHERAIAERTCRTLARLGYSTPDPVATGADAIRCIEEHSPQLVLVNIKLSGTISGISTASEINARFGIPIVYLTTHGDDATIARATASKPHGYLVKPFSDQDLRSSIDIALHKHELESKHRERERWYETTLRSIGDAVIATDGEGIVVFLNRVAEALTGYGSDEALGKKVDEVLRFVDSDGNHVANPLWAALDKHADFELPPDTSLMERGGGRLAIDDSVAPIVDRDGNLEGAVIIFRDVTEKRKLELRLAQTERLASIGTMVAGIGHEINNPLSYAISNVAFSEEELRSGLERLRTLKESPNRMELEGVIERFDDVAIALHDASDGNERVRRIVDELRKFARPDTRPVGVVDLTEAIEAAIKMTSNTTRLHAQLHKEYGTTPLVECHAGQLTQVFTNIIVNAAQAIGEGHADDHEIRIRTMTDVNGSAVVEVHDTGPGVPAHVLPRIFDAFFTTKPAGRGTGLGLAICHNLVASWGGQIKVESAPGNGTTFRVILPAARKSSGLQKAAARPSSFPPSRRGKVLVIDDERAIGEALARMLRSKHDVVVEVDGRHALARIAGGETYDIIFCDLMMPNLSGMEFHKAVLSSAPELAKHIVFMTGGAFAASARTFLETIANISIDKPFTMESVRTIVRDYVK